MSRTAMKKTWLKVTKKDIEDAIMFGEILGGFDEAFPEGHADVDLCCLVNCIPTYAYEEHCPSCTCRSEEPGDCGHRMGVWECIRVALGATHESEMLWMGTSNIISDLHPDTREIDKAEPAAQKWIAGLVSDKHSEHKDINQDLEAAALLRDGHLPPGVVLTKAKRRSRRGR